MVAVRAVRADLDAGARLRAAVRAGGVPRLGPARDGAGAVRALGGAGRATAASTLVSEARVEPVDPTARVRLRALWTVVGPFERLVGAEPLTVAAQRAEAAAAR